MHRLSLTGKEWRWRNGECIGPQAPAADPHALIARLRSERGIDDAALRATSLAGLLPDAQRAAERLRKAVGSGERIGLFGDYDCDGVTSTAQMLRWARRRGAEPIVRLPHRVRDGYGIKPAHVDAFAASGVRVLVTMDTGITAIDAAVRATELGIDMIVIDHHSPSDELPSAYAIVHPGLSRAFPQPHPSASGVTFLFLHALEEAAWEGYGEDLGLAAIGAVADLVPLFGQNRALVRSGLDALNALSDGPLAQMVAAQRNGTMPLTATDIAFRIAPRINAAGRMDDPMLALRALTEEGHDLASLELHNAERQEITAELSADAWQRTLPQADLPCLCIADSAYPHGIIGLLAGKLTERSGKPSLAGAIDGEACVLSARSPAAYNIIEGLRRCAAPLAARGTPFISLGGHAQAAGCTVPAQAVAMLHSLLCDDIANHADIDALRPFCAVDGAIDADAVTLRLCSALDALSPYGQGNPEPRLLLANMPLEGARPVGTDGKHLQLRVGGIKAIGFGLGHVAPSLPSRADIVCRVGIDTWQNRQSPQLFIEDIREAVTLTPERACLPSQRHR